jgi:enoyl-[acyl-carrier protein] reductase I
LSFLDLKDKIIVVTGVANKRSVAYFVARTLEAEGARVVYVVHTEARRESLAPLLDGREIHVCDLADEAALPALAESIAGGRELIHGLLHSIAFANYEHFSGKFHEVSQKDFLECVAVSCHSLIALSGALKDRLHERASVVAISISTTRMAVESYGYMAPAKAALDSSIAFLAKSFSRFSKVRFNTVSAALLKTNSSAGIPNYLEHYLFAEQVIPRKEALTTQEVADVAAFLLSERSSGVNAQGIVVDAGMGINFFDEDIVKHTTQAVWPTDES